jgi:diacylglycerol kinase family enzyme
MAPRKELTRRLLLYRPDAGGVSEEVVDKLKKLLHEYEFCELKHGQDFRKRLAPRATVVVAGGDGSVGHVGRRLAGTNWTLGVIPLGTYNNFATALRLPSHLPRAVAVVRGGKARRVTLGSANGKPFFEAAAVGMFGEAIALGEDAKDLAFGDMTKQLLDFVDAEPFEFTLTGDITGQGRSRSVVCTNVPATGNRMPIGRNRPTNAYLELGLRVGASRRDLLSRALTSAVLDRHHEEDGITLRFRTLTVRTKPKVEVYIDNDHIGRTPVSIRAEVEALRVLVRR